MNFKTLKITNSQKLDSRKAIEADNARTIKIKEFTSEANGVFILEAQRGIGIDFSIKDIYPGKKNIFLIQRHELDFILNNKEFMDIEPNEDTFIYLDITCCTRQELKLEEILEFLESKGFTKIIITCSCSN